MIIIPDILHPKLSTDLNLFQQKYDSIWVEFKSSKKTERSTLLTISYTNKMTPTHSKALIDYIITDSNSNKLENKD